MWWRSRSKISLGIAQLITASLLISGGSGILVAYHFYPDHAFVSVVGLDTVIPFGRLIRGVHFWSSQFFFLLLLWHLWESIRSGAHLRRRLLYWSGLVLLLPAALMALFTGYVLREDQTGMAAGAIAEHLALSVPLIGRVVNALFFDLEHSGLIRVYSAHILIFFIILWGSLWYHLKRRRLGSEDLLRALVLSLIPALILAAPLEMTSGALLIKGPWFFLGVQELLRYLPPLVAGVLYPAVPIGALLALPRAEKPSLLTLGLWLVSYFILTLVGELR